MDGRRDVRFSHSECEKKEIAFSRRSEVTKNFSMRRSRQISPQANDQIVIPLFPDHVLRVISISYADEYLKDMGDILRKEVLNLVEW